MPHVTKQQVASKHRQGNGWIVLTYDPRVDTWRESHEMSYPAACHAVREAREDWNTAKQQYNEALNHA